MLSYYNFFIYHIFSFRLKRDNLFIHELWMNSAMDKNYQKEFCCVEFRRNESITKI